MFWQICAFDRTLFVKAVNRQYALLKAECEFDSEGLQKQDEAIQLALEDGKKIEEAEIEYANNIPYEIKEVNSEDVLIAVRAIIEGESKLSVII